MQNLNTLNIQISYKYLKQKVVITWCDILFGIKNTILDENSAIDYAIDLLSNENYQDNSKILDIAILHRGDSTISYIEEIVKDTCNSMQLETKDKFLYVLLSYVYENRNKFDDPFTAVEVIYEDFDFPKEIISFVRYMPIKESPLSTKELNENRMYEHWKGYLKSRQK